MSLVATAAPKVAGAGWTAPLNRPRRLYWSLNASVLMVPATSDQFGSTTLIRRPKVSTICPLLVTVTEDGLRFVIVLLEPRGTEPKSTVATSKVTLFVPVGVTRS